MSANEQFHYIASPTLGGVTALSARMNRFSYDRHAHEEYCIGVTLKGRQDFFCAGNFHKSTAGHVLVFNPEEVHDGCAGDSSILEYQMLYISPQRLVPLMQALGATHPNQLRLPQTLYQAPQLRYQILDMASALNLSASSSIEQELRLVRLAESLVQLNGCQSIYQPARKTERLLAVAKDFIHSHLDRAMSIDEISQAANLSKYHFIRLFKAQFGITPHQYVINCRINRAKCALEAGERVTMAAQQAGFADNSHLDRKFKRVFGMTPAQYQKQLNH